MSYGNEICCGYDVMVVALTKLLRHLENQLWRQTTATEKRTLFIPLSDFDHLEYSWLHYSVCNLLEGTNI